MYAQEFAWRAQVASLALQPLSPEDIVERTKERRKPKRSDLDVKALRELLDTGALGEVTLHQDMEEIKQWIEDEEAVIEDRWEATKGVEWHVEWAFKKVGRAKGEAKSKARRTTRRGTLGWRSARRCRTGLP